MLSPIQSNPEFLEWLKNGTTRTVSARRMPAQSATAATYRNMLFQCSVISESLTDAHADQFAHGGSGVECEGGICAKRDCLPNARVCGSPPVRQPDPKKPVHLSDHQPPAQAPISACHLA